MRDRYWNWYTRAFLGMCLIALSNAVRSFEQTLPSTVKGICENGGPILCYPAELIFSDLGVTGVWIALAFAGGFFICVYDGLFLILKDLVNNVVQKAANIVDIATSQIREGRLRQDELRRLLECIFQNLPGVDDSAGAEIGSFISKQILYKRPYFVWRRQHSADIRLEEITTPSLRGRFLRWHETTSYELICAETSHSTQIRFFHTLRADKAELEDVINDFKYDVRCGAESWSFESQRSAIRIDELLKGATFRGGGFTVEYKNGDLLLCFEEVTQVIGGSTRVTVDERSLLLPSDTLYVRHLGDLTRGLSLRFTVPAGWCISTCVDCVKAYYSGITEGIVDKRIADEGREARIDTDSWLFPGIAVVLGWQTTRKQHI